MESELTGQFTHILISSFAQITVASIVLFTALLVTYYGNRLTYTTLKRLLGPKSAIYTTGWIGTPIHETSHLIACWIFHLKVIKFRLFEPDYDSMSLGYVEYLINKNSIYQRIGCLFVGIAPLVGGTIAILGLGWFLLPGFNVLLIDLINPNVEEHNYDFTRYAGLIGDACFRSVKVFVDPANWVTWQFWIFVYLAGSVSCHLTPSRSDLEGIGPGILALIGLIIVGNTIATFGGFNAAIYNAHFGNYLGMTVSLLGITLGIGLVISIMLYVIAIPIKAMK